MLAEYKRTKRVDTVKRRLFAYVRLTKVVHFHHINVRRSTSMNRKQKLLNQETTVRLAKENERRLKLGTRMYFLHIRHTQNSNKHTRLTNQDRQHITRKLVHRSFTLHHPPTQHTNKTKQTKPGNNNFSSDSLASKIFCPSSPLVVLSVSSSIGLEIASNHISLFCL